MLLLVLFEPLSRRFENELHPQQTTVEKPLREIIDRPYFLSGGYQHEVPLFKIFAELAIPNVTVRPSIDEVQMYLNRSVQIIISVSKCISQWDKDRSKVSEIHTSTKTNSVLFLGKNRSRTSSSTCRSYTY